MATFQKKPVVVEAWRVVDLLEFAKNSWDKLPTALRDAYESGDVLFEDDAISITTLEGTMLARYDDWIIQGVNTELYPCKPDIFDKVYEASL